ncbi:MAG: TMEM43 family protein [Crocinitomicaceae bacterium]|nr:TMEM43 family protein [Crocinitomicaceae bacterium]
MPQNSFTETTSQSWISRLGGSIKSILFGLALLIGSIILLWYNEGRAVKTHQGLQEGGSSVLSVASKSINPENNGKLIHVTGSVVTSDSLVDEKFGVKVNALKLKRTVEMFQWVEEQEETRRKKIGGGEETVTTYKYVQQWHPSVVKSNTFKEPYGHQNPAQLPYAAYSKSATNVNLDKFIIPKGILSQINSFDPYSIEELDTSRIKNATLINDGVKTVIYIGEGSNTSPQLGDIRLSFDIVPPNDYSIIAKQFNNTFEPFTTSNGTKLQMVDVGNVSAETMFESAIQSNKTLTWILRLIGIILMFAAFKTILKPLVIVGDLIPFIGSIVGFGTGLASGLATVALAFTVIGLAWIFYRPILGISLLLVAIGVFFIFWKRKQNKKKASTPTT